MLRYWPITIFIILSSCATYTRKQCEQFDWEKIGEGIASEGTTYVDGINYYQKTCTKKHNIEVDVFEFSKGYRTGINEFCKTSSAIIYGLEGKQYLGVCPKNKERRFLSSYKKGLNQYLVNTVDEQREEIVKLKQKLARLNKQLGQNKRRNNKFKKVTIK